MRTDKQIAFKLRLSGKSYTEIRRELGISKGTLSSWFSQLVLSDSIQSTIIRRGRKKSIAALITRNKRQTTDAVKRAQNIRIIAARECISLTNDALRTIGTALYWAEGYKRPIRKNGRDVTYHPVSLTNSDPLLIKIFLRFLREYCGVPTEKIKINLRIFPHQNVQMIQKFWEKETGVTSEKFGKTYRGVSKASAHKRPFNQLPYGVAQIVVSDTALFHKIMGYIDGLKNLA